MEMKKGLICARDLTPDTCIFCEQEGKDYCMICADTFTEEEYNTLSIETKDNKIEVESIMRKSSLVKK